MSEQDQGTIINLSLPGLHVLAFQFQLLLPHQGGHQRQVIWQQMKDTQDPSL